MGISFDESKMRTPFAKIRILDQNPQKSKSRCSNRTTAFMYWFAFVINPR